MHRNTPQEQIGKQPRNETDLNSDGNFLIENNKKYSVYKESPEITDPAFQKGILKYFKKKDYFLAGNTTADASAKKGEDYQNRMNDVSNQTKQGTFLGVILPVMQNILGVLLFIRVPQITGEAGIVETVIIVCICCLTTFLTVLSLSAIATNGKILGGGTYYLISRSMGAPIGTAVGFCFYLGTTFAGAMYILGASESFITATKIDLGSQDVGIRVWGVILLFLIMIINLVGLKYVAKTGLVFLAVVILAIISIYVGCFVTSDKNDFPDIEERYKYANGITGISNAGDNWEKNKGSRYIDNSFFVLLSIYFPSVTGIMAGANRSADLADPSKSLPTGTITAQLITSFIYISSPILFGLVADRNTLQSEEYLMAAEISWPTKYLTIVAIILSSTGAGLQCLAGAPRILDAIVEDDNLVCCAWFKKKVKWIIIMTCGICLCAVMIGNIDVITPIITMFFLLCYGMINFCCLFMDTIQFPNWRPTWKFYHKITSFLGLCLCLFLMVAISWWSFLIVIVLVIILFWVVYKYKDIESDYGDSIDAIRLISAKFSLVGLIRSTKHVKNWLPIVLVIGDYDESKEHDEQLNGKGALFFLKSISRDISFYVYGNSITGNFTNADLEKKDKIEQQINEWLKQEKIDVINKTIMYQDNVDEEIPLYISKEEKQEILEQRRNRPHQGMLFLLQAAGLGGLEPNTIMTEFPQDFKQKPQKANKFVQFVAFGVRMRKAIMVTVNDQNFAPKMQILTEEAKQEIIEEQRKIDAENPLKKRKPLLNQRMKPEVHEGKIDIWTFSYENGLMILMTYFLKRSHQWNKCNIRFFILTLQSDESKKTEEELRIKTEIEEFMRRYRLWQEKFEVSVQSINVSDWQQIEGLLLTQGKQEQLQNRPDLFKDQPVDPTSTYGMNIHDQNLPKRSQNFTESQNGQLQANDEYSAQQQQQQPSRALSVMSTNQVNKLNQIVCSYSKESALVVMNLPEPVNQSSMDYMEYIRNMTQGLQRVLLIRNTHQECITEFS